MQKQSIVAIVVLLFNFSAQTTLSIAPRSTPQFRERIDTLKTLKKQLANPARNQAIQNLHTQAIRALQTAQYSFLGLMLSLAGTAFFASTFHTNVQERISKGKSSPQSKARPKLPPPTNQEFGSFFAGIACASSILYTVKKGIYSLFEYAQHYHTINNIRKECPTTFVQCKIDLFEELQSKEALSFEQLLSHTAESRNWSSKKKNMVLALANTRRDIDFTDMQEAITQEEQKESS